ncbi:MAG: aminomethyl-transferring glycine dehydrogenase [Candidatus Cloacimonadota bacterium]|nr:MAG: aminomethyl-transferring glycine dehydrogenase [Candidatus Cloacimonadota bacterium]PIE77652.1 MAG: aminomethyl-transferring glycine dehydrogenase [Candidatus Delongbacteria bacterium]
MPYIANTSSDQKKILSSIGVDKFEDLLSAIPEKFLLKDGLNIEKGKSEWEVSSLLRGFSKENLNTLDYTSYLGAGSYDHYAPSIVGYIISRPEYQTAYTPYQAEVSQGTLQSIFEFQSHICRLTGMDVSNASMYDGATAMAEAVILASSHTRKKRVLIAETVHPYYKEVIKTYTSSLDIELVEVEMENYATPYATIEKRFDDTIGAIVVQSPNFFGTIEDCTEIGNLAHSKKALFIMGVDPISLGILKKPSELGVDIVVAEGQSLGLPQAFGGAYLGIFATTKKLMRKIPGRIVGTTEDSEGKKGFVLTLQTREQHIRRDKATSNICSNQALCALASSVYLSTMGKSGIVEVAKSCYSRAHYLAKGLASIEGVEIDLEKPFFKEFVVKTKIKASEICSKLLEKNIFGGVPLDKFGKDPYSLLVAVTEKRSKEELDLYIKLFSEAI